MIGYSTVENTTRLPSEYLIRIKKESGTNKQQSKQRTDIANVSDPLTVFQSNFVWILNMHMVFKWQIDLIVP